MAIKDILLKIQYNKRNNQLSIPLPRKKLGIDKKKIPKEILIAIKKLKFMEDLD